MYCFMLQLHLPALTPPCKWGLLQREVNPTGRFYNPKCSHNALKSPVLVFNYPTAFLPSLLPKQTVQLKRHGGVTTTLQATELPCFMTPTFRRKEAKEPGGRGKRYA